MVWCPEKLMTAVLAHVHYLPDTWKGQAHTHTVRQEFSQLFQYKAVGRLFLRSNSPLTLFWSSGCFAGGAGVAYHDPVHSLLLRAAQSARHRRLLQKLHSGSCRGRRRVLLCADGRAQTRKRLLADFSSRCRSSSPY